MVRYRALGGRYLLKNKHQSSPPTSWEKLKDFHLRLFLPLTDEWIYKSKESIKKIMKELLIYIFQNNVNYSRNWIFKNKERSELVFFMDPQNIIVDPQFVVFCLWTPGNITWNPRGPCGPRLRTTGLFQWNVLMLGSLQANPYPVGPKTLKVNA